MPESALLILGRWKSWPIAVGQEKRCDGGPAQPQVCAYQTGSRPGRDPADGARPDPRRAPARRPAPACSRASASFHALVSRKPVRPGPPQQPHAVGTGQVKVGLILPLSAAGNAGVAAQSMKNAAEMALAEFQNPEHPAPDQGRRRQPARRAARARSRRSTKAPRSFSVRCLRSRCRRPRSWRARAASP